jgi:hypothetical protein
MDTPILAAIGRHNTVKVIDLFVKQEKFNPTKLHNGKTYYEIAKARKGPAWKEEEVLLKEAYENYQKKRHKSSPNKTRSPGLRRDGREEGRDARRLPRDEQQGPRSHKRSTSSPKAKESDASRSHKRKSSEQSQDGQGHSRRGPGRPRKEESSSATAILDCEATPLGPPKQKSQPRRSEFDVVITSPELETGNKPRRKLVSGKEYRGERELEKQRRASMASTVSSVSLKDGRDRSSEDTKPVKLSGRASPSVQRTSKNSSTNQNEHEFIADRSHSDKDRARSLKRDDSKDRLTAIRGESPVKRPRKSETPPRSGTQEIMVGYLAGGAPQKRRKLETDSASENRADSTPSSSPDHHTGSVKPGLSHERKGVKSSSDTKDKAARTAQTHVEEFESSKASRMGEKAPKIPRYSSKVGKSISGEAVENAVEEDPASIISKAEEEREAQLKRQNEELEAMQQQEAAEKVEQERIEKAKQAREAREKAAREEEVRRLQEDAERKERQKQEDAEAHARAVEEQKRLYIEQERLKREEQERRRAIVLEQQRAERARIEAERRIERLGKLPLLLRWLDMAEDPKTHDIAALFRYIEGIRYDTIKPEVTGHPNGREQWMLNTHVAILLGEKDLQLSRCEPLVTLCAQL